MDRHYLTNLTRIRAVARALEPLDQKIVFVGGATVALYANPDTALEIRPTDDIDVVVELATYGSYALLEERLRAIGFAHDTESKVICRYQIQGITVDIMPTEPEVIGFSNRWYPEGFSNSISIDVGEGLTAQIFSLPHLIASKLEAYFSRGNFDFLFSRDFEDIVYLFENAVDIESSLLQTQGELRTYLTTSFTTLINHTDFEEGLNAHLHPSHAAFQTNRIKAMVNRIIGSSSV